MPSTAADYGKQSKRKFKKLPLNNAMRSQLRGLLAELALSDPDPALRLAAVNSMLEALNSSRRSCSPA